jgi:N-acetylmuramoyl-L-alanine amidase
MLPAEVTGDTAAARTAIERLASSPACADAARRALQSFPEEARIPDAPTTTRLVESAPEVAAGPLTVTKVERYGSKHSARIVVFVTQATEFELGELAATASLGPRLYVDIGGAEYSGEPAFEVGGLVQRVRLGAHPSGLRVVLDLQQRVYQRVFFLPEPPRLVIDVSRHPPRSGWQSEGGGGQLRRVVLDPGHGGHDPGAVGFSGLQEKDVALDVAHRAAPLIARELGVDTLLTRDDDEFVPLDERVAKANAFAADLFISIHCNASESIQSHGVMSFVLDASGDSLAATIAARENAASFAAMQTFADNVGAMVDSATVASSIHFAQLLQRSALASLSHDYEGVHDGGVRRAGFFVLAGARMPAVLFEVSFISNPTEEERLDTPRYRQKLADGVVNAIRAYRDGR